MLMAEIYENDESLDSDAVSHPDYRSDAGSHPDCQHLLEPLAQYSSLRRINIPRSTKFSRSDVVSAFASAFEMIGGTPRLALWANENPTEFFRLFGKLLPSATQTEVMMHHGAEDVRYLTTAEILAQLTVVSQDDSHLTVVSQDDCQQSDATSRTLN